MRIAVCIKQVPASQEGRMDPQTGVLIRDGGTRLNPYDLYALEAALRLREQLGGTVSAFTMGPTLATAALREAFSLGVEEGFLICDPAFRGADVLATSYTISQALEQSGPFDVILCGRQTTDGDTAQVGPAIAAQLGIPCVGWVEAMPEAQGEGLLVWQRQSGGSCQLRVQTPCVLSMEQDSVQPRLPTLRLKLAAGKKPVRTVTLAELPDTDPEHYGLKGSPTRVKKIFTPEATHKEAILSGEPEQLAAKLVDLLWPLIGKKGGEGV